MTFSKKDMPLVFDNIIFSLQNAGGISIYWVELIKRFSVGNKNVLFFELSNDNIIRKTIEISNVKKINRRPLLERYLPFLYFRDQKFLFHSSYYRVCLSRNAINIVTVHDFTYEKYFNGLLKYVHILQKKIAINFADGIICVSNSTKADLLKYNPHIDPLKITVIPNGVSDGFFFLKENKSNFLTGSFPELIGKNFVLYVGSRAHYKNFAVVVDVLSRSEKYSLVIAGGNELQQDEKLMLGKSGIEYIHYSNVSESDLNILYNNAHSLLYISSYEGFGIPVLEAFKAGCPVVGFNSSSIPEVGGDAILLVNKLDASLIYEKLTQLDNAHIRELVINKGFLISSNYSWEHTFNQTEKFYKKIFKKITDNA